MPEFLTTREVAELLRIKERKVYELAGDNAIPVCRVTGKLLFPRDLVAAWVRRNTEFQGGVEQFAAKPLVLAGSHDPLLDWALRESGSEIATFFDGSLSGLNRLAEGKAVAAGLHVFEAEHGDWNVRHVMEAMPGQPVVLLEMARRTHGLVVPPGNPKGLAGIADLKGLTVIPRQRNAGSYVLLEHLRREAGLENGDITFLEPPARNETDVALAVAEGKADAGLAIRSAAHQFRLDFVPLAEERYDLAVWRRDVFEPPMQKLLAFCRTPAFAARARELGGYDISGLGRVHYNGP